MNPNIKEVHIIELVLEVVIVSMKFKIYDVAYELIRASVKEQYVD